MKKRPARTLLEVCTARVGVLKGGRVVGFVACWAIASESLGRAITLEDYMEWWGEKERTAYNHQASFRAVFPHLSTPQPLVDALRQAAEDRALSKQGVTRIGQMPAPGLALAAA